MAASQGDHLKLAPGTLVNGQYEVLREVGCGNFSKVYEARDVRRATDATSPSSSTVALKVVKKEYANDAKFERDMLKILGNKGQELQSSGCSSVSTMHEFFTWNHYPCFIMPLRGPTLRSCKLGIDRGNCSRTDFIRLAHSLLTALKFVHFDCKMVHTDLKPENILLNDVALDAAQSPLGTSWTVCDFGSASLWRTDRMDSDLISTRPYRAPEVVLGNPWSYPADTWSLGCILYEVAVGTRLFDVHDDNTHLNFMEKCLGRLPDSLAKKSKHSRKYFDPNGKLARPLLRAAQGPACRAIAAARAPRSLQETLGEDDELYDLIGSMLQYDPARRIRVDDALHHPIFEGMTEEASGSSSVGLTRKESSSSLKSLVTSNAVPLTKPIAAAVAVTAPSHKDEAADKGASPTVAAAESTASAPATPEPVLVAASKKPTPGGAVAAAAMKYRVPISLLSCAAVLDAKENHHPVLHPALRAKVAKTNSSGSLTNLLAARAASSTPQPGAAPGTVRTGSAAAVRPHGQLVNRTTYANYALRLKVNART